MGDDDVGGAASAILVGVGVLARRLRQTSVQGELTPAERAALARLSHAGPATSAELARAEQISPQAMGVTLSALERHGLIGRDRDPHDGRRVVFSFTDAGRQFLRTSRNERADLLARALADGFTSTEIRRLREASALLERLALHI